MKRNKAKLNLCTKRNEIKLKDMKRFICSKAEMSWTNFRLLHDPYCTIWSWQDSSALLLLLFFSLFNSTFAVLILAFVVWWWNGHFLYSMRLFSFKLSLHFKLLFKHYKIAEQFRFEIYSNLKTLRLILARWLKFLCGLSFFLLYSISFLLKVHTFNVLLLLSADPLFCFRFSKVN